MSADAAFAADPGWMTIGEVLTHLNGEFPDISISKIRYLEGEGLIAPQRANSGYRRFADADVAQLRLVLLAQRDHYLPLRVIKEHLAAGTLASVVAPDEATDPAAQGVPEAQQPHLPFTTTFDAPGEQGLDAPGDPLDPAERFSRADAVALSGLTDEQVQELLDAGVVAVDQAGRIGGADVGVCRAYRVLQAFGVDHRHMRQARNTASRESFLINNAVGHLDGSARADSVNQMLGALSDAHYWLVLADLDRQPPARRRGR